MLNLPSVATPSAGSKYTTHFLLGYGTIAPTSTAAVTAEPVVGGGRPGHFDFDSSPASPEHSLNKYQLIHHNSALYP